MAVPEIPDKFYFKIGEVSSLLGVKPYVVRFWETEFDLAPAKNRSRHRVYKKHEVQTLLEIRRLLYDERFTIEGAQKKLKEQMKNKSKQLGLNLEEKKQRAVLQKVKKDLEKIREMLRH
ncbi:MAG: MerR family transcriptional regulator [Candidatus Deferrimicrobiaceae bacterium]